MKEISNYPNQQRVVYSTRYNGNIEFRIKNNHIDNIIVERNKKRIKINYINKIKNTTMFTKIFDVNNKTKYTIYDYKRNIPDFKYRSGFDKIKIQNNASSINETIQYNIYYE